MPYIVYVLPSNLDIYINPTHQNCTEILKAYKKLNLRILNSWMYPQ